MFINGHNNKNIKYIFVTSHAINRTIGNQNKWQIGRSKVKIICIRLGIISSKSTHNSIISCVDANRCFSNSQSRLICVNETRTSVSSVKITPN